MKATTSGALTRKQVTALQTVLDYLWEEEEADYAVQAVQCEENVDRGHIFVSLQTLRELLDRNQPMMDTTTREA